MNHQYERNLIRARCHYYIPIGPKCEICGFIGNNLVRHHPDIENYPNIIVTVCKECHDCLTNEIHSELINIDKHSKAWLTAGDTTYGTP